MYDVIFCFLFTTLYKFLYLHLPRAVHVCLQECVPFTPGYAAWNIPKWDF